jgi:selT/selW/selH-like putative selenoprotein
VRGRGGVFDITADDRLVFSKHDKGRFPSEKEIIDRLRSMD